MIIIISDILLLHFAYIYSKLLTSDHLSQLLINYIKGITSNSIRKGWISWPNFGAIIVWMSCCNTLKIN